MFLNNTLKGIRRIAGAFDNEGVQVHFRFVLKNGNAAAGARDLARTPLSHAFWREAANLRTHDQLLCTYALAIDNALEHDRTAYNRDRKKN
ncbi:unnamed protein product [Haemonchus placei]|uniref:RNase H domain-containing protein n=1 Tax=Haemonchus placei TaxID=6290 RepID=A0A0N4WDI4_HAEPC|nr:unnamed protein product [Haemonchus placei]